MLLKVKEYLVTNKEWLFSGVGVSFVAVIIFFIKKLFRIKNKEIMEISNYVNNNIGYETVEIYQPRSEFEDYFSFIVQQANKSIDAISITFGFVSYIKLEKLIEDRNIIFNFYILDKNSIYYKERIKDIDNKIKDDDYLFKKNLNRLKELQNKFPNKVFIYSYDNYPFWHYMLVDEEKLYFSYHPIGALGYKVSNVFKITKSKSQKIFKLHLNHIKIIKKESVKI